MTTAVTDMRELTAAEIDDTAGGTISLFKYTFHFLSGPGVFSVCVDNGERYGCLTNAGDKWYTSSGNVPK